MSPGPDSERLVVPPEAGDRLVLLRAFEDVREVDGAHVRELVRRQLPARVERGERGRIRRGAPAVRARAEAA